jgi:hypothetical protein
MHNPTKILKEIIPLTQNDCCTIFAREKQSIDYPLHYHEEIELNFIMNAPKARRIIGDHMGETDNLELVLIGST